MEQDTTAMNNTTPIPGNLPGEKNQAERGGWADGLSEEPMSERFKEQAKTSAPSGPTLPGKGEDVVLFVEAVSLPEQEMESSPENLILSGIDQEMGVPWYRSRWMYIGTGLVAATALSIGTTLLLRRRSRLNRRLAASRTIIKPIKRIRRRRALSQATPRMQDRFSQWGNQLSGQASRLTDQTRGQLSRLTRRTPGTGAMLNSLQRQSTARALLNRTRRQLGQFSAPISRRVGLLRGAARTRAARTTSIIQGNLTRLGAGAASGVEKVGTSLKHGWKIGRSFALGAAAGALWAMLFTPQSGETTRQRLAQPFRAMRKKR